MKMSQDEILAFQKVSTSESIGKIKDDNLKFALQEALQKAVYDHDDMIEKSRQVFCNRLLTIKSLIKLDE